MYLQKFYTYKRKKLANGMLRSKRNLKLLKMVIQVGALKILLLINLLNQNGLKTIFKKEGIFYLIKKMILLYFQKYFLT